MPWTKLKRMNCAKNIRAHSDVMTFRWSPKTIWNDCFAVHAGIHETHEKINSNYVAIVRHYFPHNFPQLNIERTTRVGKKGKRTVAQDINPIYVRHKTRNKMISWNWIRFGHMNKAKRPINTRAFLWSRSRWLACRNRNQRNVNWFHSSSNSNGQTRSFIHFSCLITVIRIHCLIAEQQQTHILFTEQTRRNMFEQ